MFKPILVLAPIAASVALTLSAPAISWQPPDLTEMLLVQAGSTPGGRAGSSEPPVEIYDAANPRERARPDSSPGAKRDTKSNVKRDTEPSARRDIKSSARRDAEQGTSRDTEPGAKP